MDAFKDGAEDPKVEEAKTEEPEEKKEQPENKKFIFVIGRCGYLSLVDLGVQQCFGVVYHELTTLRRVYFARAAC